MLTSEATVPVERPLVEHSPAAAILRSGVFDVDWYCQCAGYPSSVDLGRALEDYIARGEAEGLAPHALFEPSHVHRQLEVLGIPLIQSSVLLTYLAHPKAPLDPHPLFDQGYFARKDSAITALEDYLKRRRLGEMPPSPNVLFDREFYYERNPDVAARKVDAFVHYVRQGWKENRQPHPLFNTQCWSRSLSSRGLLKISDTDNPLSVYWTDRSTWVACPHPLFDPEYFLKQLAEQGLAPCKQRPPLADMLLRDPELSGNRLFDPAFYRLQAEALGLDVTNHPLAHYTQRMGRGKLDPHPLFSESFYLTRYRDVSETGPSPLEHFLSTGQIEGRDPNPLFSQKYYRSANSDVPTSETRLLEHYVAHGHELLDPHPLFDSRAYAARYPECLRRDDTPLAHYRRTWAEHGWSFPPWGTAMFPRRRELRDCRPPDVVLVSHELSRTGAPAILLRIVQHLVSSRGLRTLVLAIKGGELLQDFCEWSATVDLSLVRNAGLTDEHFMELLLASFGESVRPRLAIINTACVDQATIQFDQRVPVVSLVHELASGFPESYFVNIYDQSDLVIYPAEFVRNEAHLLYPLPIEQTAVLPQGLLNPDFGKLDRLSARSCVLEEIGAEPDAFIVLGCGTLDQRKGLDTFLHVALATLRLPEKQPSGRPVHFIWIGGGPSGRQSVAWYAQQDIDRSGMAGRVHLLGAKTNTEPYFVASDAFVMTSRMDPFPCVIHEAMVCGKPIIAFADAGGAPEALADGAGIIVDYGDVAGMAAEILLLRSEPNRADAFGARAREVVRTRYVFSDYVDRILSKAQERVGITFAQPIPDEKSQPAKGRVVVTCGESEGESIRQFSEYLVGGLLDRGFDAELLYTGDPREMRLGDTVRTTPYGMLGPFNGRKGTHKERWDALTRVLEVAAPVVLIHNLDGLASALAPMQCPGMGVLGVVHEPSQEYLEQAARLGRYWQRVVTTSQSLTQRVLDAAPFLANRVVQISHIVRRYPAPEPRSGSQPLAVVVSGRRPQRDSSMPFLLPLVRGLRAAAVPFTLTVVGGGSEAQLLRAVEGIDLQDSTVRVLDSGSPVDMPGLLGASDILILLSRNGAGIDVAEALHAGLAVINLTQDPEIDAWVHEGVNGFSLPRGTAQACVALLRQLNRDRELLERLRGAAHQSCGGAGEASGILDAYASLLDEMLDELRSRAYEKPAPLYVHPVFGALSLPPMFQIEPGQLGFPKQP